MHDVLDGDPDVRDDPGQLRYPSGPVAEERRQIIHFVLSIIVGIEMVLAFLPFRLEIIVNSFLGPIRIIYAYSTSNLAIE